MFLHIGGDAIVPMKEVVAIFDIRLGELSQITREFLEVVEEEGFIRDISGGKPKSFVVTSQNAVYISPISASTLKKRASGIGFAV